MIFSGRSKNSPTSLTLSSRGYIPAQTDPRPSAVAASSIFSAAADQS